MDVARSLVVVISLGAFALTGQPSVAGAPDRWAPEVGATFQWQLQGQVDRTVEAEVYDIDLFESPRSLIDDLHSRGRHVVCYMSAGSYERWRSDADQFPNRVLGKPLEGWPGERWLDVRKLGVLREIMSARLDRCATKGFDAVEFDNVDGYSNRTGFPLTKSDQLRYLDFLSSAAHERGLAAGLKNLPQLARRLEPQWDFVVNEQCFQYDECSPYSAFIDNGKPVFQVEYELTLSEFCPAARNLGFTSMRKRYSLKAWRRTCD